MVKKLPSELPDAKDTITSSAIAIIEQDGIVSNAPIRPNPENQINVRNQAQLEASILGASLEFPDNSNLAVVIDKSFELTKPLKLGLGTRPEVYGSTPGIELEYTGPGKMFQNTNSIDPITSFSLHDILLKGDGTNSILDLVGSSTLAITNIGCDDFNDIGISNMAFDGIRGLSASNMKAGLILNNPSAVLLRDSSLFQTAVSTPGTTFITVKTNVATKFNFLDNLVFDFINPANLALLVLDQNAPAGARFTIRDSSNETDLTRFFQQGTDIAINSVADNGSGKARFTTAASHGVAVGNLVKISGFVTETTYNVSGIVTAVDTPITGTTFDVEEITFTATDTGNMNAASLDSENKLVFAVNNPGVLDSMFTGKSGLEIFGSEVTSSVLAQNAFEVITSASWSSINLERFLDGVVNTGQLVCDDPATRKYNVGFSATIEKSGGGSLNLGIVVLKNGIIASFNSPHTVNSGKIQIRSTDIIELTEPDTLDIAVINFDAGATAINISQASLVVSRA